MYLLMPSLLHVRTIHTYIYARSYSSSCPCSVDHKRDCVYVYFMCVFIPFILDVRLADVPAGVTQEEGHTGFLIRLPSAVLALIFLARRI